jgi:uncharacterized protein (UPF0332 family)
MGNKSEMLAKCRIEKAQECAKAAEKLLEAGLYGHSANRSYYTMFHAIRAVLAPDQVDFRTHEDVLSYFRRRYIITELFPEKYITVAEQAYRIKEESDYEDFFEPSQEEAVNLFQQACGFLDAVREYLEK